MEFPAMILFFVALALIIVLFIVKGIEARRGRRFIEPLRTSADHGAMRVKSLLTTTEEYIENLPWFLGAITRYGVHVGALSFARLARVSETQAHRLADLVSHKHRFERRETKSKYLKEVSGYKAQDNGVETQ